MELKDRKFKFEDVAKFYIGCKCVVMEEDSRDEETIIGVSQNEVTTDYDSASFNIVKPKLREFPTDMTDDDEEATGLNATYEFGHHEFTPFEFVYFIEQGFDMFGLIANGEAIKVSLKTDESNEA